MDNQSNKLLQVLKDEGGNYILPFFWQHGETEEVLRTYMKAINEANIQAVCVESRPHPDYCGPKWWQDMDVILDEARKRGMKVWILDDSHFPTGFANGAMEKQPLSLARKSICCKKITVKAGETVTFTPEELKHPVERPISQTEQMMAKFGALKLPEKTQNEFEDDELIAISAVASDGRKVNLTDEITADGLTWTAPAAESAEERITASSPAPTAGAAEETAAGSQVDAGTWSIYQMNATRNRGPHMNYINMTDDESVRVLIDAVYEPHWNHYKEDFGKTIAGFFSDEPELGNGHLYDKNHFCGIGFDMDYPWSRPLAEKMTELYGQDLGSELPLLWETEGDEEHRAQVKYAYMDQLTRLVEKNFSFQLGDWCRAHGVKYIGHMIEDNGQHARTGSTLGHYFRGLAGEDWGGIDDIGGQVYPFGEDDNYDMGIFQSRDGNFYHYLLGKLASSAAAIDSLKKGDTMCEIFGAYGWNEGVQLEKYLADHFMCRGINHFVPHAFSAKAFPDPDCPPHFYAHGHNPQYLHFGSLMKYMNRVCALISGGQHKSPIALIYSGEGEWTGKVTAPQLIARPLVEAQIDYDILPQDIFLEKERYSTKLAEGSLQVNGMAYEAVVIPYMQFITAELAAAIKDMKAAGIPVIFAGGVAGTDGAVPDTLPEGICNKDKQTLGHVITAEEEKALMAEAASCLTIADPAELPAAVKNFADISLSEANRYVHYYHYIHKDGMEVYMMINEGKENFRGTVTFAGRTIESGSLFCYDAWNNTLHAARTAEGKLAVDITPRKSLLLIFPADESQKAEFASLVTEEIKAEGKEISFEKEWTRSICESLAYPAFSDAKSVSMPDALHEELPSFSGFVRYENTFQAAAGKKCILEITDSEAGIEVFINGASLGIQIVKPYIYDLSSLVKDGENSIVIEAASTLERAMYTGTDMFGRPQPPLTSTTGITGEIKLYQ